MKERIPKTQRLHIGIFGRTNVGKSSLLNFITQQEVSIISPQRGTTTDVVVKTMELLPLGPVVFFDTAGLDDITPLRDSRFEKTLRAFDNVEVCVLVMEPHLWSDYEDFVVKEAKKRNIPLLVVVNKIDKWQLRAEVRRRLEKDNLSYLEFCALEADNRDKYIAAFKEKLRCVVPAEFFCEPSLAADLIPAASLVVLVVPIDLQAPRGRLILPQVRMIREILDSDAACLVVKEREYPYFIKRIAQKPALVVCDSQIVLKMVADTPPEIKCTTFSILFSRYKGDLTEACRAAAAVDCLAPEDKVLILEACSHHPIEDDIGRVKIPRWLSMYKGFKVNFDTYSGWDFPSDLSSYKLIIHCGGCMLRRRQMLTRLNKAKAAGVAMTNYGVVISFLQGVWRRVLEPFPVSFWALKEALKRNKEKRREDEDCAIKY